jgi:hypothetical protein
MMKDADISEHNWSFRVEKGKYKLTLGNLSDAGWYWDGDGSDLMGFIIRLKQSKITQEFLTTMEENGVSYKMIKADVVKSAKGGDGVYEVTGDNRIWHFGEYEPNFDDEDLTPEEKEKVFDFYEGLKYDKFYRKYGSKVKAELIKVAQKSNSFEDVLKNLESAEEVGMEWLQQYQFDMEAKAIKALKRGK